MEFGPKPEPEITHEVIFRATKAEIVQIVEDLEYTKVKMDLYDASDLLRMHLEGLVK